MKNITLEEIRDLLDDAGLTSRKIDDNSLTAVYRDGEDGIDFVVKFELEGNRIQIWTCEPGLGVELDRQDALEFCNKWNRDTISPKIYVDKDGDFIAELNMLTEEEISKEYVKLNFISLALVSMRGFIKSLRKFSETGVFET